MDGIQSGGFEVRRSLEGGALKREVLISKEEDLFK